MNEDLESEKYKSGCTLTAVCLMDNHSHEIPTIDDPKSYSNHMRRVHSRYGQFFNKLHNRSGKVAEDRPTTCLIEDNNYEMNAVFYTHANPLRAKIVKDAKDYHFSTHMLYAYGKRKPWMRNIKLPKWYLALGRTMALRQRKYRSLFAYYLKNQESRSLNFKKKLFFGSYLWMENKQDLIQTYRKEHSPPHINYKS